LSDRPQLSCLEGRGLKVRKLAEFHYRVEECLDLYPNARGRDWRFHHLPSGKRGSVRACNVHSWVPAFLAKPPAPKIEQIPVGEAGWWNCAMPGCDFKMRDDGSAESAKRMTEHMESH
jgi:hypothetical protein